MPIKWTPENDQILLLKILETSNVNADVKAISAAWPDNFEKPTPRAITERLVRIRGAAKSSGASSHFSVSSAKSASSDATPRKRNGNGNGTPKSTPTKTGKAGGSGGKRKRAVNMSDEDPSDDSEGGEFKAAFAISDDESPSKKAKGNGKVKLENPFGGDGVFEDEGLYA